MKARLHLKEVRERQKVTVRTMAKSLGVTTNQYLLLEDSDYDFRLSELQLLQEGLRVPISELIDEDSNLILNRCAVIRAYKSALSLKREVKEQKLQLMINRLLEDLLKIIPEMDGSTTSQPEHHQIKAWQVVGSRQEPNEPSMRELSIIPTILFSNVIESKEIA